MAEPKRARRMDPVLSDAQSIVASQVPESRQEEILRYLELFGYKPEKTILQVYIPGFFRKRN